MVFGISGFRKTGLGCMRLVRSSVVGGIEAADDRTKVKVESIKALCRHLKEQGFVVVPSEQIRIYFAVCGNVP